MANSKTQKKSKKAKKMKLKYGNIATLIAILASAFLIYNILLLGPIEPVIRYIIIALIIGIDLFFLKKNRKVIRKQRLYLFLTILFIIINCTLGIAVNKIYSLVDNLNKNKIIYSTSLIAKKGQKIENIEDVVNKKIGILNDVTSIDNYILANEMIEKNNLKEDNEIIKYDNIMDMLQDLYKQKIDLMFISSNYQTMFQTIEEYGNIENEVIQILDSEKSVKKEESITDYIASDGKNITKPFTILLMGVDSEAEGMIKNASNGDSLILLTFNPKTLNATMLSIPRDSYVPIACFKNQRKNKLTHAGWYGANCMIETIQNFLDVKIDYYVKINFKGVVSLVDILDGVTVDVPKKLCTDNSSRIGTVCINPGTQKLDGEGALVLARNRYNLARGDLDRGNNQQLLLKALLNEMKNIKSVNQVMNILTTVSNNIDTNMTTNQILSLYNILKDILQAGRNHQENIIPIQKLELVGEGKMIYEQSSKLTLWNYVLNDKSIKIVSQAMNENLNLTNTNVEKSFNYSIQKPYQQKSIGKVS